MGKLAIKIDVDTYRGTRDGTKPLCDRLEAAGAPALFLFSLGPDNTGKAMRRIFRPGFLKKCLRSNVAGNYGLKTLLYGTLLPAPMIAKKCAEQMRMAQSRGFELGIHSWDHFKWQDYLFQMCLDEIREEFSKARAAFEKVFGIEAKSCGAAGWQCSPDSLQVQDEANLMFASDTRGSFPFIPKMGGRIFNTIQIPSTMPTLDEMLGTLPIDKIADKYFEQIERDGMHVMTIHSELEGNAYAGWFGAFLKEAKARGVEFFSLEEWAGELNSNKDRLPVCEIKMKDFPGRSTTLAQQVL